MNFNPLANPKDFMFEGHPEIEIVAFNNSAEGELHNDVFVYAKCNDAVLRPNPRGGVWWEGGTAHTYDLPDDAYISGRYTNAAYRPDGTPRNAKDWPRIVPRPATIDWHKPVFTGHQDGQRHSPMEVKVHALVTPIDPAEAPHVLLRFRVRNGSDWSHPAPFTLNGTAMTGFASGHSGKLSNIEPERVVIEKRDVRVTYRGDVPIKVELL